MKTTINLLLRLVLGALFIYAGSQKLMDPAAFQIDIAHFQLVPWAVAGGLAVYLPWLEILSGAALIFRRSGAAWVLGGLVLVFTVSIATAWSRGLNVDCGCFGSSGEATNYPLALGRNLLLLFGLGGWLWLNSSQTAKKSSASPLR